MARRTALPVSLLSAWLLAACGPSTGFSNGRLTLVTRSDGDRDGFVLSTSEITNDWRAADFYVFVRTVTSLTSEQGEILCARAASVSSSVGEISSTTSDCVWTRSLTGPNALLARDRTGALHRIRVVEQDNPDTSRGYMVMDIAKVE